MLIVIGVELSDLTFHTQTEEEILALLSVSPTVGLDTAQAQRRLATNGPNALSPPPSRAFRKAMEWIFGGFGSLLLAASIVSPSIQSAGTLGAN